MSAKKIELIRMICDTHDPQILEEVRNVLSAEESPAMTKRLQESRQQVKEGRVSKIDLNDIWK